MQERASVKDIAKELNISLSTVHKALTGKPGVGEARRKEVLKTARRMGYVVNGVAQSLARKDIRIGIMMPSKWQDYFAGMKCGIEKEIEALRKYKVEGMFYYLSADLCEIEAEKAYRWIQEKKINVLIYCPSMYAVNEAFIKVLQKAKVPVFLAGGNTEKIDCISEVCVGAALSGTMAADFLHCTVPRKLRAIAFIGSEKVRPHKEKINAFCERVNYYGGEVVHIFETLDDPEKTLACIRDTHDMDFNAIYVATATSEPVCRYIEENHLAEQVVLLCTDLFDALKYYMKRNVVKATIYQNQEEVGRRAVRAAYDYFVGKYSYGNETVKTEFKIEIRPSLYLLANIE